MVSNRFQTTKFILLAMAVVIVAVSLWYTQYLSTNLAAQERKKVTLWAKSIQFVANSENTSSDISFIFEELIKTNTTLPSILTDEQGNIISYDNILIPKELEKKGKEKGVYLQKKLKKFKGYNQPIELTLTNVKGKMYVYYMDSTLLQQLRWFPYVQLALIAAFIMLGYVSFNNARRAEQNRVWVGLAKETAHQLGTPLSGLIAWIELLKLDLGEDAEIVQEMSKDVHRLQTVTERFSKIGAVPELKSESVVHILAIATQYVQQRLAYSKRVKLEIQHNIPEEITIPINKPLFEWVIENLVRNAIDAMPEEQKEGKITIFAALHQHKLWIDVQDNGKGIAPSNLKKVFKPGFSTKQRGWGLGLSLTKRIVEEYHKGKIYVKQSVLNVGTTFRIELPLQKK